MRCRGIGVGTSSIRTAEQIVAKAGWVAAESESVVVSHDPVTRTSAPLSPEQRATLEAAIAADAG